MRALSAAIVVLLLAGCLPFHLLRRDGPRDPEVDQKVVAMKEDPTSLIASDGSRCLVGEKKFAGTDIGDWVWCMWSEKNGRKTAYSWGDVGDPSGQRRAGLHSNRAIGRPRR